MNLLKLPNKLFVEYGGRLAIFLVKRRVKKTPQNPALWLMLAKLYHAREATPEAIRTLKDGLRMCPGNAALKHHLNRLKEAKNFKEE